MWGSWGKGSSGGSGAKPASGEQGKTPFSKRLRYPNLQNRHKKKKIYNASVLWFLDSGRPATSTLNRFSALQQSSSLSSTESDRRAPQRYTEIHHTKMLLVL